MCSICHTGSNELILRVVLYQYVTSIATQARQREEGRGGGDARGGGRSGGSGCFKCGEEVGSLILSSMDLEYASLNFRNMSLDFENMPLSNFV